MNSLVNAEKAEEMRKEADDAIARNNRLQAEREAAKRLEGKLIQKQSKN